MRSVSLVLRSVLLAMASCMAVYADEARPVYVEVEQLNINEYLLKWKIPPVMSRGQEPAVEFRHGNCSLANGALAGRPASAPFARLQLPWRNSTAGSWPRDITGGIFHFSRYSLILSCSTST